MIDYCKKNKKIKEIDIDKVDVKFLITNPLDESYEDRDELINLYKKIHRLDEKSKEVIYLRVKCEFNFREIGNIMGKSEEWTRITFYRAKIKLKEELKNE